MKNDIQDYPIIKVIYYTYPQCPVSWSMQEHWQRLVATFGQNMNIRFCLPADIPHSGVPPGRRVAKSVLTTGLGVKAASLQSQWAANQFVDELRKAAMEERLETASKEVIFSIALKTSRSDHHLFDYNRFCNDFYNVTTRRALDEDFLKIRINAIDKFPAITFTVGGHGLKVNGYNSYPQLLEIIQRLCNQAVPERRGIG